MVVKMQMEGGFKRVGLKQEFFVELLLCSLTIYNKLGSAELSTFLPISLENSRQAHQLSHLRNRVITPSSVFRVIVSGIKESNHENFKIELPLQSVSDD